MSTALRSIVAALLAQATTLGCADDSRFEAQAWPEANRLFQGDPRFMGADGAYSVDLGLGPDGEGRVLWLFGDTFVATNSARDDDAASAMVRNSLAVQTGYDPSRAFIQFYWGTRDGQPSSFVPEKDEHWFWPGHGIRVKDRALLFYGQVHQTSPGMWGFDADGWGAFVVENPDQEPSAWTLMAARVPKDNTGVDLGNAVLLQDDHLLVYGNSQDVAIPKAYLARFELEAAMQGDLSHPEWWTGNAWGAQSERAAIVDYVVEYSVSFDQQRGEYLWVETAGGGATTLAVRTASEPQGPWSERRDVLRPPESYRPGAFVYAGKAHPELRGADLVLTYVPSTFDEVPDVIGDTLYYPYFARMTIR